MNDISFTVIGNGHIGKRHKAIIEELRVNSEELRVNSEELRVKSEEGVKSEELRVKSTLHSTLLPLNSTNTLHSSLLTLNSKSALHSAPLPLNSIISICTPNFLHCSQAIEAMQNGHDVIIEKPMGLTAAECREVIKVAAELDRKVFCVMQNRFSPPSKWLKEMIGSGRLGKIYQVQVNCFWNRSEEYYKNSSWKGTLDKDGGTLYTQFSHFIDTLFWLFGDIEPIIAQFFNHNHPYIEFEDSGVIEARGENRETRVNNEELRIKSEELRVKSTINSSLLPLNSNNSSLFTLNSFPIQINYSTSCFSQNLESSITILAENGTIKVGGQYMEKVLACHVKDYEMPILEETLPPNDYGTYKGSASNHVYVYQNVMDVLAGKAEIACTAEEGLKVVEFIEKVYKLRVFN